MEDKNTKTKRGRPAGQSRSEIQVVGYLTRPALLAHLDRLTRSGAIGHWWAVEHAPDEEVHKAHWHLRMTPPPSRSVNWAEVLAGVVERVDGEPLPRRLVASAKAVNDQSLDGLLYARHDARYCDAKGLTKATYNLPRAAFLTDCPEWLDALWNEADTYAPAPKRMTAEDLCKMVEENPDISTRALLRAVLVNGLQKGVFDLLTLYRNEVRRDRVEMPRPTPTPTPTPTDEQPTLWDEWPSTPTPAEPWEENR